MMKNGRRGKYRGKERIAAVDGETHLGARLCVRGIVDDNERTVRS